MGFSVVKQLSVYAVHIWVVLAIVARTNADICSSLQCPETQTEDASGSAAELQDYEIVVSKKEFTPGGGIKGKKIHPMLSLASKCCEIV